jgi:hypothetical protein
MATHFCGRVSGETQRVTGAGEELLREELRLCGTSQPYAGNCRAPACAGEDTAGGGPHIQQQVTVKIHLPPGR